MVCVYPLWFNIGYAAPTFGTVFVTVLAPTATACLLMTYVIHQRIRDYRETGLLPVFPRFGGKFPDDIETGAASGAPKVSTVVSPRALSPSRPAPLAQVYQAGSTTPTLARKFLSRLPVDMDHEVIYIKTEGHYLRVFTKTGSSRLLMRFADAMAELSGLGMQVHRSYWVADDHIVGLVKRDNRTALLLTGDHVVPVSRTYLRSVRAATSK